MSIRRIGRVALLVPVLLMTSPVLLPLLGRDRSKPPKPAEPPEPAEFTKIIYRVIANEWQIRTKLQDFSPRIETYLQYYRPEAELGDVATNDDYFLGRLKFSNKLDNKAKEASFIPDSTRDWLRHRPDMLRTTFKWTNLLWNLWWWMRITLTASTTPSIPCAGNTWAMSAVWRLMSIPVTLRLSGPLKDAFGWRIMTTWLFV